MSVWESAVAQAELTATLIDGKMASACMWDLIALKHLSQTDLAFQELWQAIFEGKKKKLLWLEEEKIGFRLTTEIQYFQPQSQSA